MYPGTDGMSYSMGNSSGLSSASTSENYNWSSYTFSGCTLLFI
jgi:hypothetical protein